MLDADDVEALPAHLLKKLAREILVQLLAPAREALEHGIVWGYELDHQQVGGQFRGKTQNVGQRDALGHEHVVNDGQHQNGVESAPGPVEEGVPLAASPAPAGSRAR